ncbi:UNVERIFIED_CONTAM: Oxysterol-binding protein-related protein 2B [Sesamum calycinum]|uniref:Oxysterol-binding protein-related protein 2B n=1 Tax=Sesamum calycinum TaxID=2727403 RepID=A0AAW2M107_9LAMI
MVTEDSTRYAAYRLKARKSGLNRRSRPFLRTGSAVNFFGGGSDFNDRGSDVSTSTSVAGVLYKWTNYGKGWRSRWFTLRSNGILSYSKTFRPSPLGDDDVVVIGSAIANRRNGRKHCKNVGIVHLKVEGQFQVLSEERSSLLDTLRQLEEQPIHESHSFFMLYPCEVLTYGANIEAEVSGINGREYELMKQEYTNLARGKYSEWSTTESSDDVGKQELEEASDEETHFFDTNDYFLNHLLILG